MALLELPVPVLPEVEVPEEPLFEEELPLYPELPVLVPLEVEAPEEPLFEEELPLYPELFDELEELPVTLLAEDEELFEDEKPELLDELKDRDDVLA